MHDAEDTHVHWLSAEQVFISYTRKQSLGRIKSLKSTADYKIKVCCAPNVLISSLLTESTLYSSANDLQRTTRRKKEFLPEEKNKATVGSQCWLLTLTFTPHTAAFTYRTVWCPFQKYTQEADEKRHFWSQYININLFYFIIKDSERKC